MSHGVEQSSSSEPKRPFKRVLRAFAIEFGIYGILLIFYFYLVLEFLAEPLDRWFETNQFVYAFATLALVVARAVVLEATVYFIIDLFQLNR